MVKAKLIENESYFKLRQKQLIVLIIASIAPVVVLNVHTPNAWIWVSFGVYLLGLFIIGKNQKKISEVFGNRSIEMDDSEIRLTSKKRNQYELMVLDGDEVIILEKDYCHDQSVLTEFANDLDSKSKSHSIIIRKGGYERKLQFELDSHYMVTQLKKVIETWTSKGYQIVLPQTVKATNAAL